MPAFNHILVATDGSAPADRALALALRLAEGARVSALLVVPDYGIKEYAHAAVTGRPDEQELRQSLVRHGRARLDHQLDAHGAAAAAVERLVLVADSAYQTILETAKREGCDLIVLGSHGLGTLIAPLLGSQVTRVLAHAAVPVLVATGP